MTPEEILDALGPFVDPATELECTQSKSGVLVTLIRDGKERRYFFDSSTEAVHARHGDSRRFSGLNSLLASEDFADLRSMAATQRRTLSALRDEPFIEPRPRIVTSSGERHGLAELRGTLGDREPRKTRVVLLDGPAGIGKTTLLERLTLEHATDYSGGRRIAPILYVGSRGRRLSNLRDTLAGATQVLRTRFTFEQVPVLVRRGLLVLAIDGFDELVDADGYQDAWFVLREFLDELASAGVCILAGRDTFFDQQGFLSRLESVRGHIDLVQAHLEAVLPEEAKGWLLRQGWTQEEVASDTTEEIFEAQPYTLRPYFLSMLSKADGWDDVTEEHSVRSFLVSQFLKREASLVENIVSVEQTRARSALGQMFEEAALDMSERESTEVDVEFLGFLCEVAFEGCVSAQDLRKLQHKAGSFALLERSASDRLRSFPHTEIQHHFLAKAILRALLEQSIPAVLRRGVLGIDFLEVFQDIIDQGPVSDIETALMYLNEVLRHEISTDRLPQNGGSLLLAALTRSFPTDPRELVGFTLIECALAGPISDARLRDIDVYRLDVRGADLGEVTFEDVDVSVLIVDSLTRFGQSAPNVNTLHVLEAGQSKTLRAPEEIESWISDHSESGEEKVEALPLARFFDRVCRRALRQFYFRPDGNDSGADLLDDPLWPEVEEILERFGRLRRKRLQTAGPAAKLIHVKHARALVEPSTDDSEAVEIRRAVVERAGELERQ